MLWAKVRGTELSAGRGAVRVVGESNDIGVEFDQDVSRCAIEVTIEGDSFIADAFPDDQFPGGREIGVGVEGLDGQAHQGWWDLAVFC